MGYHNPPPAAGNALSDDSASSSNTRYTPVSDGLEEHREEEDHHSAPGPGRYNVGSLRLQTDFGDNAETGGPVSEGEENGYDSEEDLEGKRARPGDGHNYTPEEEKEVVSRFDRRLVTFLALLYLLAFLDRSSMWNWRYNTEDRILTGRTDIGNAKIADLQDDLNLSSSQYEWLLTAFYITYILFEWMTLMYRIVPPHIYISLCVCGWGLVASFQCLATSFGGLVVLRALLGITEAAFGPGVPFYLSLFYRRHELAFRNGLFISAAPLATSFASTLAWVIVKFSSNGPISPWRILFLVEGFPSVIVAVFAWVLIPDSPGRARFLTRRQRAIARLRLEEKKPEFQPSQEQRFNWGEIKKTLSDPKAYIAAVSLLSMPFSKSRANLLPDHVFQLQRCLQLYAGVSPDHHQRVSFIHAHSIGGVPGRDI